jgi:UDP-glucose 4-epimerase
MNIGITGGAGFIGSRLSRHLVNNGENVLVYDNLLTGKIENLEGLNVKFIKGDIEDIGTLKKFVDKCDLIIHLAAVGSVPKSIKFPDNTFRSNVVGTFNLLELIRLKNLPLIFSSSSSVYGNNGRNIKSELDFLSPISPYGASKLSGEALILSYARAFHMKAMIFRFFNVFGPGQIPNSDYSAVIPRWAYLAMKKEDLIIYGNGRQTRDFTYIDTVVEVICRSIYQQIYLDTPINLALGKSVSLNDLIPYYKEFFGKIRTENLASREGDVVNSLASSELLLKNFGPITEISLKDSLHNTFNWIKSKYK